MDFSITAFIMACIAAAVIAISIGKSRGESDYDERQVAEHGRAYHIGFIVTITFCLVSAVAMADTPGLARFAPAFLSGSAMAGGIPVVITLVWRDAYFTTTSVRRTFLVACVLGTIANLGSSALTISRDGAEAFFSSGSVILAFVGLEFLAVLIACVARTVADKADNKNGDC